MAIKGVLWYQGEANALRAAAYTELMTQLIGGWRADWQQADLPFVIMQLVNFGGGAGA
jgi:sialate O-acetylesterase